MSAENEKELLAREYERYAEEFSRGILPEDFAETMAQASQRAITLASLTLVSGRRHDFHLFNELLVRYPVRGRRELEQVVPDNVVVMSD